MDPTLQGLVDLLLNAVPTIILFIILTIYLKYVFFRPLAKVLDERKRQTEGVREIAERAFAEAERKTSEFEHALQLARQELFKEHEALRQQWLTEQAESVARARAESEQQIREAKAQIADQTQRVEAELSAQVDSMSEQILRSLLKRRAA
jgi:F0F1-type ATP synthase membrane subunit b/b'